MLDNIVSTIDTGLSAFHPVASMQRIHATCVVIDGVGVLLRGKSGSGKSDLALRLLENGATLIADDQVLVSERDGHLIASSPQPIAGLLEVRGMGVVRMPFAPDAVIHLVADLVPPEEVERMPEPATIELLGQSVRNVLICPFEASAVAKVRLAAQLVNDRDRLIS